MRVGLFCYMKLSVDLISEILPCSSGVFRNSKAEAVDVLGYSVLNLIGAIRSHAVRKNVIIKNLAALCLAESEIIGIREFLDGNVIECERTLLIGK